MTCDSVLKLYDIKPSAALTNWRRLIPGHVENVLRAIETSGCTLNSGA